VPVVAVPSIRHAALERRGKIAVLPSDDKSLAPRQELRYVDCTKFSRPRHTASKIEFKPESKELTSTRICMTFRWRR